MTKNAGLLPMPEMPDVAAQYLGLLGMELHERGMWCELVTTGCVPRLKLSIPWRWAVGLFEDKAFEDHILATDAVDGQWRFWWPWILLPAPSRTVRRSITSSRACATAAIVRSPSTGPT
jgi:hypothetical protein